VWSSFDEKADPLTPRLQEAFDATSREGDLTPDAPTERNDLPFGEEGPETTGTGLQPATPWASSLARGSAFLFIANLGGSAGFFVAVLLLARGLDPSNRGTVAFITVSAAIIARFAQVGMSQAATVFAAQRPKERGVLLTNLVLFVAGTTALAAALSCGALLAIADARPAGLSTVEVAILGLGSLAIAVSEGCYAFLLGCGRFRVLAAVLVFVPWLYAALLAGFSVGPGLTVVKAAAVWTVAMGSGGILLFAISVQGAGLGSPSWRVLVKSIKFGLRAWLGSFSNFLNFRVDQVLMGFIATTAALGTYTVAVNAGEALLYLPNAIGLALVPVITRSEPAAQAERTLLAFRALLLITLPAVVLAALLGPRLLPAVFGGDYGDSVTPFLWLLPGAFGFAAVSVFSNALFALSAPGFASLPPLVALLTGFALDLALIPRYGAVGAAAAASVAFLAGGIVGVVAYRTLTGFAWRSVLPHRADIEGLRALAVRLTRTLGK
jgi:O-antigen/teichoic acid export membrane protein